MPTTPKNGSNSSVAGTKKKGQSKNNTNNITKITLPTTVMMITKGRAKKKALTGNCTKTSQGHSKQKHNINNIGSINSPHKPHAKQHGNVPKIL